MWPFTGGCHYSMDCTKYKEFCGKCPQLESNKPDISSLIHWSKRKSWDQIPLTVVAPSAWLAGEAKASTIFRDKSIKVIPHGTDLNLFKRSDQIQSKKILGLDLNKDYLLFASTGGTKDKRKGFAFLHSALNKISKLNLSKKIELLILGSCANNEEFDKLRLPFRHLGIFHDDVSLKVLYSACSLTVTPSLQEAFGMTASESMACGTPVVAFNQCGAKDVVDHMINGYLATPNDSDDLADGIMWSLKNRNRLELEARLKCEKAFDLANVSQRYVDLYKEVINMRHQ